MLEGENLFGYNYQLGTKNINVDIVDEVQAIERYSENQLLKGIEDDNKVALNLKIKKGKFSFSGNIETGGGRNSTFENVYRLDGNLLGISRKYKSFGNLAFNNIGINHTPFNYFGKQMSLERLNERDFYAKKTINDYLFSPNLDETRFNLNSIRFGSYNSSFSPNKNLNIKFDVYGLGDLIKSSQFVESRNAINSQEINYFNSNELHKNPYLRRVDLNIKSRTTNTSSLEYDFRVRGEDISTTSQIVSNNLITGSKLNTHDGHFKQSIMFTKRISSEKALQVSGLHSHNSIDQRYSFSPSTIDTSIYNQDFQRSDFAKNYLQLKTTLLGSKQHNKYSITFGATSSTTVVKTSLIQVNKANLEILNNPNDLQLTKNDYFNTASYQLSFNKLRITTAYSIKWLDVKLKNNLQNIAIDRGYLLLEPSLHIRYQVNDFSIFSAKANYIQDTKVQDFLYSNNILINNRTFSNNTPDLSIQKTMTYSISFQSNDLYRQFQLNVAATYRNNEGNFFSRYDINERFSVISYFFLNQHADDISLNFAIEKYSPFLESTIGFRTNVDFSRYKDIVNSSNLRNNKSRALDSEFSIRTAFDGVMNFEGKFNWLQNNSETDSGLEFIGVTYVNSLNSFFQFERKWLLTVTADYFSVQAGKANKSEYFFLDGILTFKPSGKKYDLSLAAKNMFNNDVFSQVETTDYSTNFFRLNLIPRYLLLNLTYKF